MGKIWVGVVVFAVAIALAGSAAAEDKEAARRAHSEGTKYYNLNQFANALEAFKRAYWNYEDPSFLYNIAQCHRALKHKSEAIDFYRSYLRNAPDAPNREEVQRIVTELEAAIAQEKAVTSAPPQGTIPDVKGPDGKPSAPAAVTATERPPTKREKPLWKRGWLWGVVAGAAVVAAGVAIGVGVAVSSSPKDPTPSFGAVTVN
jgi:tetratricopeptide (TPR) repeat protein